MPDSLSQYSPQKFTRYRTMSIVFALLACSIGGAALLGWIFEVEFLKRIHPLLVTMKANTAVCLMLTSLAVLLLLDKSTPPVARRLAQVCAAIVAVVGLLTLSEHLLGWNLRIDELLFKESDLEAGQSFPGRMGIAASLDFFLLGAALLFLDVRPVRRFRLSNVAVLMVISITLLVFLYYFYGIERFEPLARYLTIALHTV